jgi:hypothetical protein
MATGPGPGREDAMPTFDVPQPPAFQIEQTFVRSSRMLSCR